MEGAEGQYSGMQIGQLQDEEDEATNILQDDSSESFRNSSLGMLINAGRARQVASLDRCSGASALEGSEDSCNGYEKQITRWLCEIRNIFQHLGSITCFDHC